MEKQGDILTKIRSTILRYGMISPGDTIIVAVSSGPDSICLLNTLYTLSSELVLRLVVAHFNHGLRGGEDEFETQLSSDISATMGLPFETEKASDLLNGSSSLEDRARNERYSFLKKILIKHNAQKIATGHNLNDQVETVLMRLLRGSGPTGLAGIPPVREGRIIRPLIGIKREEIIQYLKIRSLPYAVDSSNNETKHLRNRIRLELIPILLEYQPRLLDHLDKFSKIIRDEDALLESIVADWIDKSIMHDSHSSISLPISALKSLPDPLKTRVIRNLLRAVSVNPYPMEYDHINSVSSLLDNERPQCMIDLPYGIIVRKTYDALHFTLKLAKAIKEFSYTLQGTGTYRLDAAGQTIKLDEVDRRMTKIEEGDLSTVYLDADKLQFPLIVRNFRPGDRFIPLGMNGHKKIKKFFIDLKVPSEKRALTPLLISGDRVVWICGYRLDERFRVISDTKKVFRVALNPNL
jgi:tRNA(Ile)-lysidine synthase